MEPSIVLEYNHDPVDECQIVGKACDEAQSETLPWRSVIDAYEKGYEGDPGQPMLLAWRKGGRQK
jgi:hypothetical protein